MKTVKFFLASLATITFLFAPWWLPRIVSIPSPAYTWIGFGGGTAMVLVWCWIVSGLAVRIAFRLFISTSGAVGYVFAIRESLSAIHPITEDPLFIGTIGIIAGLLFIGAVVCCISCLYWPEFNKEDIKV